MTTDQLVKYIIDLLNIKVESEYSILEINSELTSMSDPKAFIDYIRSRLNMSGFEYMTGFQKFVTLAKQYRQIEAEAKHRDTLSKKTSSSERLASKVREIDMIVLNAQNDNHQWEKFKLTTGEQYFTDREILNLSVIGSPLACVRLQRSISGRDMLCERLEEIFVERVMYPQLEAPVQSNNLIANLAKEKAL